MPFVERVIRRNIADRVAGPLAEARREQQPAGRSLGRILRKISAARATPASAAAETEGSADEEYRRALDEELRALADDGAVTSTARRSPGAPARSEPA